MMDSCNQHDRCIVVYEGNCPICDLEYELQEARKELDRMDTANDNFRDQICELEQRIKELEAVNG